MFEALGPWTPAPALLSSWRSSVQYTFLKSTEVFEAFGALDPSSGTAQLREVVKLGILLLRWDF